NGIRDFDVRLGRGSDSLTVNGLNTAQRVTIDGNRGNDQVTIGTIGPSLDFDGGLGSDSAIVRIAGATPPAGLLNSLRLGIEELTVDNSANAQNVAWSLNNGVLSMG